MALVAYCIDDPQPALASDFSACTEVVWLEPPSIFPALTVADGMEIAAAAALFWAAAWAGRLLINSTRL